MIGNKLNLWNILSSRSQGQVVLERKKEGSWGIKGYLSNFKHCILNSLSFSSAMFKSSIKVASISGSWKIDIPSHASYQVSQLKLLAEYPDRLYGWNSSTYYQHQTQHTSLTVHSDEQPNYRLENWTPDNQADGYPMLIRDHKNVDFYKGSLNDEVKDIQSDRHLHSY